MKSSSLKWHPSLDYIILAIIGFGIPSLFYFEFYKGDTLYFYGYDPLFYIRNARMILEQGYASIHDYYYNYPHGLTVYFSLYNYILAGLSYILTLGNPTAEGVELACAFAPPILNILVAWLLYYIGKTIFNRKVGIFAGILIVIFPDQLMISMFARPDHHILEPITTLIMILSLIKGIKSDWKQWGWAIVFGLDIAFALNSGLYIMMGYLSVAFLFIFLYFIFFNEHQEFARFVFISFSIALLGLLPSYLGGSWVDREGYTYYLISKLHIFIMLYTALPALLYYLYVRFRDNNRWVMAILFLAGAVIFVSQAMDGLMEGIGYASGAGTAVMEFKKISAENFFSKFSYAVVTIPFIIGVLFYYFSDRKISLLLTIWLVITGLLATKASRYGDAFALSFALMLSFVIVTIWEFYRSPETSQALKNRLAIFLFIGIATIGYMTYLSVKGFSVLTYAHFITEQEAFTWLNENSPPTSHFLTPDQPAEYGVLCSYNDGFSLVYHSERPTTGSNMHEFSAGNQAYYKFLLLEDEKEAYQMCQELNISYAIVTGSFFQSKEIKLALEQTGQSHEDYLYFDDTGDTISVNLYDRFYHTMGAALGEQKGQFLIDNETMLGLSHFRLIYDSPYILHGWIGPYVPVHIYEIVEGANLEIEAKPNQPVSIKTEIQPNPESSFTYQYRQDLKADSLGIVKTIIPYATTTPENFRRVRVENFTATMDTTKIEFAITENMVQNGKTLALSLIK